MHPHIPDSTENKSPQTARRIDIEPQKDNDTLHLACSLARCTENEVPKTIIPIDVELLDRDWHSLSLSLSYARAHTHIPDCAENGVPQTAKIVGVEPQI